MNSNYTWKDIDSEAILPNLDEIIELNKMVLDLDFDSKQKEFYQNLVNDVDPALSFQNKYLVSTMMVFNVTNEVENALNDGAISQYTFKGVNLDNKADYEDFKIEIESLNRAGKIEGLSSLVKDYGVTDGYHFILKESFPGYDARSLNKVIGWKLSEAENKDDLYNKMKTIFTKLHESGQAGFDQAIGNMIISPDLKNIGYIDHSGSKTFAFKEGVTAEQFNTLVENDLHRLRNKFYKNSDAPKKTFSHIKTSTYVK